MTFECRVVSPLGARATREGAAVAAALVLVARAALLHHLLQLPRHPRQRDVRLHGWLALYRSCK